MNKPTMKWEVDVVDESYYNALVGSGYAWEMYPDLPESWARCLELLDFKMKQEYIESTRASNYEASSRLEGK
jgi:hypothetical protein